MTDEQKPAKVVRTRHVRYPTDYLSYGFEGGVTLRYSFDREAGLVTYKYSICNPKDQYSRKLGIKVADAKPDVHVLGIPFQGLEYNDIEVMILTDLVLNHGEKVTKSTRELILDFISRDRQIQLKRLFFPK